jgi:PAS domain S-box-containing protein
MIAVFAVFLCFALFKLAQVERQMRIEASENMLWVLTQTQREMLQFDATVGRFGMGMASSDELSLHYDLLLSRLNLLRDQSQRRKLEQRGLADDILLRSDDILALEPLVERYAAGEAKLAQRIANTLGPLNSLLTQAANAAMQAEWDERGRRLDQTRAATWQTIGYVIVIMVAGALLSIRLVLTLRRSRRTEGFLRREKQFSELVIDSSGEGILAIDREGRCTLWNAAMERLIPVPAKHALGAPLSDVSGIFSVERVRKAVQASLGGALCDCTDQPIFCEDAAKPRYLNIVCSPLRGDDKVIGVLIFVRDVTEQRAVERALVDDRDELEKLVAERTVDLQQTQEQLIATMQELERALDNERSAAEFYRGFASAVSHQFRTPLAIIDSSAQRLIRRGDKITAEEVAQRAVRIRANITRLSRFVEATLDAARLETGRIEVKAEPCNFADLVLAACARQKELTPERKIVFSTASERGIFAMCDPTLCEHILSNLLSNAVRYSSPESPIELGLTQSQGRVQCAVADQGVGVPENEVPRLFERFFRASTAVDIAGTGIGLSLSRELAWLQEGDITVATSEGKGSTFTLAMPAIDPARKQEPTAT